MRWTHKVVYEGTGQWWMAVLRGGILYHNGLHEDGDEPRGRLDSFQTKELSIEAFYNRPGYKVIKLKKFKGNL